MVASLSRLGMSVGVFDASTIMAVMGDVLRRFEGDDESIEAARHEVKDELERSDKNSPDGEMEYSTSNFYQSGNAAETRDGSAWRVDGASVDVQYLTLCGLTELMWGHATSDKMRNELPKLTCFLLRSIPES